MQEQIKTFKAFGDLAKQLGNSDLSDLARAHTDAVPTQEVRGSLSALMMKNLGVTPRAFASGGMTAQTPRYDLPSGMALGKQQNFGMDFGAGVDIPTDLGTFGLGGRGHAYAGSVTHPDELRQYMEAGDPMKQSWSGSGLDSIQGTYSSPPTPYYPQGKYGASIDVNNNRDTGGFFEDPSVAGRLKIRF
ncbi:MAG: hypothetical protein P8R39_11460 [Alphaproteobacteria bacterium]|nr:hypothetical protein [Alphaproteobacteria bacterium]